MAIIEQQILEQEKPQLNNQQNETIIYSFVSHVIFKNNLGRIIDDKINHFFEPIVAVMAKDFLGPIAALGFDVGSGVPIVVIWLVFGALFFTFKMNLSMFVVLSTLSIGKR